jgi:branched-subunit amino acid ABC-type transport system permease component
VQLLPGMPYSAYRLLIIGVGLAVAVLLYFVVTKTRIGMLVRAGASNREMAMAMGVDIKRLFTLVFGFGAALCAIAGAMLGPILASIHNLTFYQRLVARLRDGVLSGRFDAVCRELLERLAPAPDSPG